MGSARQGSNTVKHLNFAVNEKKNKKTNNVKKCESNKVAEMSSSKCFSNHMIKEISAKTCQGHYQSQKSLIISLSGTLGF